MTAGAVLAPIEFERPTDRNDELRPIAGVRFLDLPVRRFVMIDGDGAPGEAAFTPRMPGLYATAWTLRFALKGRGVITKVGPLEGLWWTSDGNSSLAAVFGSDDEAPDMGSRGTWRWTLLITLPDEATEAEIAAAVATGRTKLEPGLAANLRVEPFDEGRVAQVLHLGPYAAERATIERLHETIHEAGLSLRGRHHEIYLGDPRRSAPERLRTILRQPVD